MLCKQIFAPLLPQLRNHPCTGLDIHLHFIEAAKQNICVLALVLLVAYFDLRAFIALLRREDTVLKVKWVYVWVFIAFFIVFAVVRNLLLVYAGIDPLGDNKAFWGW